MKTNKLPQMNVKIAVGHFTSATVDGSKETDTTTIATTLTSTHIFKNWD